MPGKVNPVIPEVVLQVGAQVIGNDTAITIGGMQGQFELNVRIPLIARNLLQSIHLLSTARALFAEKCVDGHRGQPARACEALGRGHARRRHRAEPVHRLRQGRRDRQGGVGERRARCARSRASTASTRRRSTRRSTCARSPRARRPRPDRPDRRAPRGRRGRGRAHHRLLVDPRHAWPTSSPATAAIFRCAYALPLLRALAWREDRRLGPRAARATPARRARRRVLRRRPDLLAPRDRRRRRRAGDRARQPAGRVRAARGVGGARRAPRRARARHAAARAAPASCSSRARWSRAPTATTRRAA